MMKNSVVSFLDGAIAADGSQIIGNPEETNSYVKISSRFATRVSSRAKKRMRRLLSETFYGNEPGLNLLLAQQALAVMNVTQPDIIAIVVGKGGEGKSLFLTSLLRNAFGTGFAGPPGSVLQV